MDNSFRAELAARQLEDMDRQDRMAMKPLAASSCVFVVDSRGREQRYHPGYFAVLPSTYPVCDPYNEVNARSAFVELNKNKGVQS